MKLSTYLNFSGDCAEAQLRETRLTGDAASAVRGRRDPVDRPACLAASPRGAL